MRGRPSASVGLLSNLTRLLQLPVDGLKIDREIASAVRDDPRAAVMVATTVALANQLRLEVTAEGVEAEQVREHLAAAACDWGQGWLYSPGVPEGQLNPLLDRLQAAKDTRRSA